MQILLSHFSNSLFLNLLVNIALLQVNKILFCNSKMDIDGIVISMFLSPTCNDILNDYLTFVNTE